MSAFIYYLGLGTALCFLYKALLFPSDFRPTKSSLSRYKHGEESRSLIKGAGDGIGYAFAQELVHRGFCVILLGRNVLKLETVRTNLERDCLGSENQPPGC